MSEAAPRPLRAATIGVCPAQQLRADQAELAHHAVASDPLTIRSVEVVRGPATLLYGPNTMGGVVNVMDDRIPR